jgi:hypothetical protein
MNASITFFEQIPVAVVLRIVRGARENSEPTTNAKLSRRGRGWRCCRERGDRNDRNEQRCRADRRLP